MKRALALAGPGHGRDDMLSSLEIRSSHHPEGRRADVTRWRALCFFTLGAFLGLGLAAYATGILPGDLQVRRELLTEDRSALRTFAGWMNLAGTWRVLLPVSLAIAALSRAARRHWWLWAGAFLASAVLEQAFKILVDRPRPSGFSLGFPSGHTTAAAVFAVIAVYVVSRERLPPTARLLLQIMAVAMMILVGWARIVLHAHWPTDVLGGLLLGTGCAAAAIWWESSRPTAD
jgi:undecaprenyl-diphosphatase